jgi:hypothetical protein
MQKDQETYENVIMLPITLLPNDPTKPSIRSYYGGMYDSSGNVITSSLRGPKDCLEYVGSNKNIEGIDMTKIRRFESDKCDDVIFMGFFADNYGHFLIETMGRMKYALDNVLDNTLDKKTLVFNRWFPWFGTDNIGDRTKYPLYQFFVDVFNLKKVKIVIVDEPILIKKITIPIQYSYINHYIDPVQISVYSHVVKKIRDKNFEINTHEKLFLIRYDGRVKNEGEVYKLFEKYGFSPIHLTQENLIRDISYVNNAKIIAGVEGTNMHNAVLMNPNMHTICIEGKNKKSNSNHTITNQNELCKLNKNTLHRFEYVGDKEGNINIEQLKSVLEKTLAKIESDSTRNENVPTIVSAKYDSEDVTYKLRSLIKGSSLNINSNFNRYFGDPRVGAFKFLHIVLSDGSERWYGENRGNVNLKCK